MCALTGTKAIEDNLKKKKNSTKYFKAKTSFIKYKIYSPFAFMTIQTRFVIAYTVKFAHSCSLDRHIDTTLELNKLNNPFSWLCE